MELFVLSCLVTLAATAPQQFVDQFGNQQFISDIGSQQFVSDVNSQQFVSDVGSQQFADNGVRTVSTRFEQDQNGNYEYGYELSDGQKANQVGRSSPGSEPETGRLEQQGSYEFVGDDGNTYQVSYLANENGFQPQGAHLPQPPAQIPEYDQLRQDYPQLFWAENGGAGIVLNNQQFNNQQFGNQQFDNQQFNNQQFQSVGQFIN